VLVFINQITGGKKSRLKTTYEYEISFIMKLYFNYELKRKRNADINMPLEWKRKKYKPQKNFQG